MSDCTLERFQALAASAASEAGARLVPVWRDVLFDRDTAVSAFAKIRRAPFGFLLESAPAGGETWSRYTFLGTEPHSAWRLADGVVEDWDADRGWHSRRQPPDPLDDLEKLIAARAAVDAPGISTFWWSKPARYAR